MKTEYISHLKYTDLILACTQERGGGQFSNIKKLLKYKLKFQGEVEHSTSFLLHLHTRHALTDLFLIES